MAYVHVNLESDMLKVLLNYIRYVRHELYINEVHMMYVLK